MLCRTEFERGIEEKSSEEGPFQSTALYLHGYTLLHLSVECEGWGGKQLYGKGRRDTHQLCIA